MHRVTIKSQGKIFFVEDNKNLLEALLENNIFIENPCNGMGTCGKCKFKLIKGSKTEVLSSEKKHLSFEEISNNIRLSCFYKVVDDIEIEILAKEKVGKVLTSGFIRDFKKDENLKGYGLACDIGTTTVVMELVDLHDGRVLHTSSMVNPQKNYGLDVLTRITYEYERGESGIKELKESIIEGLNKLIIEITQKTKIDLEEVKEIVVGANTTMLHLLLGIDARSLGKFPYKPEFKESKKVLARRLGLNLGSKTTLYTLPNVSAFIGSDIVAGAYVCNLHEEKGNVLFIDIGTNGEIVLNSGGKLVCCSCAAGPALEGMNISSGMRAAPGAIEDLTIFNDKIEIKTIEDEAPLGLCGSGILAALRELLKHEIVLKSGAFVKKEKLLEDDYRQKYIILNGNKREFLLNKDPRIIVTQGDVRQVQLAKGAILSGFIALLNHLNIKMEDLDRVLIAGQFGAHLPCESLIGCGILPVEVKDKLQYVGNTSKTGAYMALLSKQVKEEMNELAKQMEYVELAVTENYESIFRNSMVF